MNICLRAIKQRDPLTLINNITSVKSDRSFYELAQLAAELNQYDTLWFITQYCSSIDKISLCYSLGKVSCSIISQTDPFLVLAEALKNDNYIGATYAYAIIRNKPFSLPAGLTTAQANQLEEKHKLNKSNAELLAKEFGLEL